MEITSNEGSMTEEQRQSMRQSAAEVTPLTATVYVDRSNYYLRRMVVPFAFSSTQENAGQMSVNIDMRWSDHNQPVVIDVPEVSQDASQVMSEVMSGATGSAVGAERLQEMLNDQDGAGPVELDGLSAEEKRMLEELGIEL